MCCFGSSSLGSLDGCCGRCGGIAGRACRGGPWAGEVEAGGEAVVEGDMTMAMMIRHRHTITGRSRSRIRRGRLRAGDRASGAGWLEGRRRDTWRISGGKLHRRPRGRATGSTTEVVLLVRALRLVRLVTLLRVTRVRASVRVAEDDPSGGGSHPSKGEWHQDD